LEITASTVGSIHLGNYFVENITITGNAVGSIQIWAKTLNGDLSAVGNMQYKGNPRMNMDLGAIGGFRQIK
jgi:hypothetical protein